ncbi:MAG TPA: hypothetical protein VKY89_14155 [Thermoanaerobaculia bacterium]|nr:hypothetical protein [Thermoanaerobaculia bacterium]
MPTARWLAAFMDPDHVTRCSAGMPSPPPASTMERWGRARAQLSALAPVAPGAAARPLGEGCAEHLAAVSGTDLFRSQTAGRGWSFAWVDLRRMVSLQESVNLDYLRAVAARHAAAPGEQELLELCLPRDLRPRPGTYHVTGSSNQEVTIHSDDLNLMVIRAGLEPIEAANPSDPAIARVSLVIGKAWHHVHVLAVGDRCFLKNGYHRAVGLLEAGVSEIPCVLLRAGELTAADCARWPDPRLLASSRPPLLGDFLDPALTVDTPHKRIVKVVHAKVEPFARVEVQQFEIAMPAG